MHVKLPTEHKFVNYVFSVAMNKQAIFQHPIAKPNGIDVLYHKKPVVQIKCLPEIAEVCNLTLLHF